jgi:hypothetical protein
VLLHALNVQLLLLLVTVADDTLDEDAADCTAADGGSVLDSSKAWVKLAAQLPADIPQQPSMVKGGQLREYQMQVWLLVMFNRGAAGAAGTEMQLLLACALCLGCQPCMCYCAATARAACLIARTDQHLPCSMQRHTVLAAYSCLPKPGCLSCPPLCLVICLRSCLSVRLQGLRWLVDNSLSYSVACSL